MPAERKLSDCRVALSPGAQLSWLGFSEEGLLAAEDTEGELRVLSPGWGGSAWVPLFSADRARQSGTESYWLVGCSAAEIACVIGSDSEAPEPPVPASRSAARPVISTISTCPALLPGPAEESEWFARRLGRAALAESGDAAALSAAHRNEDQARWVMFKWVCGVYLSRVFIVQTYRPDCPFPNTSFLCIIAA